MIKALNQDHAPRERLQRFLLIDRGPEFSGIVPVTHRACVRALVEKLWSEELYLYFASSTFDLSWGRRIQFYDALDGLVDNAKLINPDQCVLQFEGGGEVERLAFTRLLYNQIEGSETVSVFSIPGARVATVSGLGYGYYADLKIGKVKEFFVGEPCDGYDDPIDELDL